MKHRIAIVLVCALLLGSCQRPFYTWIVNGTGERLVILHASLLGLDPRYEAANGSPWWWPLRTKPTLGYAGAHKLTSYGFGDGWFIEFERANGCKLAFAIPNVPDDVYERQDWRVYTAYDEAALQLDSGNMLYRIPARSTGNVANLSRLDQPEGYPIAPTESDC